MSFNTGPKSIFYVPKASFESWQSANDPEKAVVESITIDDSGYTFAINDSEAALQLSVLTADGAQKFTQSEFRTFKSNNSAIFGEGEDDVPGDTPPARGVPFHPNSASLFEYEHLYDGTNATMVYNDAGNSVWTFPASTLPNGLDDVDVDGDFIRLSKAKFGAAPVPVNESRYIYIDANTVWMHTWTIVSKAPGVAGEVVVTLTIPSL